MLLNAGPLGGIRVLLVGADAFMLGLLVSYFRALGVDAAAALTTDRAQVLWETVDPHVVVADLDGAPDVSMDFLSLASLQRPFVPHVVLSSHWAPELIAAGDPSTLLTRGLFVVKSAVRGQWDLARLVSEAISGRTGMVASDPIDLRPVSSSQASLLRLVALGASNAEAARCRGTSVRAVEAMLRRVFDAVEAHADGAAPRVVAARHVWAHQVYVPGYLA